MTRHAFEGARKSLDVDYTEYYREYYSDIDLSSRDPAIAASTDLNVVNNNAADSIYKHYTQHSALKSNNFQYFNC